MICEFFWDFDGTLFDTYPRMARAMARALAELAMTRSMIGYSTA